MNMTILPEHSAAPVSPWVQRFASLVPVGARVLDYACGSGRHARLLAGRGARVDAVDRDQDALERLSGTTGITTITRDLEGDDWLFQKASYDALIVTNYLHRPRFSDMLSVLAAGGVLIYETFMIGNEKYGRPRSPDFLLMPDELLDLTRDDFSVVAFEQGEVGSPPHAVIQSLCAIRGKGQLALLPR